jgi:hypothetical protein
VEREEAEAGPSATGSELFTERIARLLANVLQYRIMPGAGALDGELERMPHPGDGWRLRVRGPDGRKVCVNIWPDEEAE